jgi:hypothetical protein
MMRPLGAAEQLLWLAGNHRSTHFAIAVELSGELDLRALQHAFDQVCTDTLFRSKFVVDDSQIPWFVPSRRPGVVVVLKDGDPSEWSTLLTQEVSTSLNEDACLIRVSVLKAAARASIVFTAHHALIDGTAALEILEAVIRRLAGEPATVSVPGISMEEMVKLYVPQGGGKCPPQPRFPDDVHIRPPHALPALASRVLGEAATSSIGNKARDMGVTVYSVVCASLGAAMLLVNPLRASSRFVCPVDLRKRIFGGQRHVGMYSTSVLVEDEAVSTDIWSGAQRFAQSLDPYTVPANLASAVRARRDAIARLKTPKEASRLLSRARADFLVSNLGEVGIPGRAGALRVDAIWGPSVSLAEESLQTIGMLTHAGRLHFLHSSYRPVIGLLDTAVWLLESSI